MDDTSERLVRVETKLDNLLTLNDTRIIHIEGRVALIEAAMRWMNRLVIGVVVVAILGLVVLKQDMLRPAAQVAPHPQRTAPVPGAPG